MPFTPGDGRVFDLCDECRTSWADRIKARAIVKAHADGCPDVTNCAPCAQEDPHATEQGISGQEAR